MNLSRIFPVAFALALAIQSSALHAAEQWVDISTQLLAKMTNNGVKLGWPGGCSGVVANRLNGNIVIKVVGQGLWRSADQGANWQRIDNNTEHAGSSSKHENPAPTHE